MQIREENKEGLGTERARGIDARRALDPMRRKELGKERDCLQSSSHEPSEGKIRFILLTAWENKYEEDHDEQPENDGNHDNDA